MVHQPLACAVLLLLALLCSCSVRLDLLAESEVVLLQFDTRPLRNGSYWTAAAQYNQQYCRTHGHQFAYYTLSGAARCNVQGVELAAPWCKVRAMMQAQEDYPLARMFLYLDSDAIIDRKFFSTSVLKIMQTMHEKLPDWDPETKPMVFNQDGPSWWCKLVRRVGYHTCLNAGTVLWLRSPISADVLTRWWHSALDSYEDNPIKRPFRLKWPWEQDRQMAVYHRDPTHIQIASHPDLAMMPERAGTFDWCLSHLPGNGCFISHYCANKASKNVILKNLAKIASKNSSYREEPVVPLFLRLDEMKHPFQKTKRA